MSVIYAGREIDVSAQRTWYRMASVGRAMPCRNFMSKTWTASGVRAGNAAQCLVMTRLKLVKAHVERLFESALCIHGNDFEGAVVHVQRDHATLRIDDANLRGALASARIDASLGQLD